MHSTPALSTRHLVAGSLLAGLAVTGAVLPLRHLHSPLHSVPASAARAQAQVLPSVIAAQLRAPSRASRGGARTVLPTRYVRRTVASGRTFSGYASWYGGSFQGQRTANGERFDTQDLTAASKTLPFGTRLRVCREQRCVVVRVNDRGPYVSGRVLDLSKAARDELGHFGVARVTVTPVRTRRVAVRRPVPVRHPVPVVPVPLPVVEPVLAAASSPEHPQVSLTLVTLALAGTVGAGAAWGRCATPRLRASRP
jgi:rare lipoprotein A